MPEFTLSTTSHFRLYTLQEPIRCLRIGPKIERMETTDSVRRTETTRSAWHAWSTHLALAAVVFGVALVVASIGPANGVFNSGRALTMAVPAGPPVPYAPIGLVSGLLLYVSGLWLSVQPRVRET
jgi:hypothetical protein